MAQDKRAYAFGLNTATKLHKLVNNKVGQPTHWKPGRRGKGDSSGHRYYKLLEDASGIEVFAEPCDRTGASTGGDPLKVGNWLGIIDGAQAGYIAQYCLIDGNWDFQQGPCVTKCESGGSITVGTPVDGEVGTAYPGHTVTESGLDPGSLSATGLPAGLTMGTGGDISGTPTEAGTFYIVLSGTADKTGPGTVAGGAKCTVTKVMVLTIAEAP